MFLKSTKVITIPAFNDSDYMSTLSALKETQKKPVSEQLKQTFAAFYNITDLYSICIGRAYFVSFNENFVPSKFF